ncbi:MAG: biotin transporter BioY [Oscillospiraceae bacterium]|nr:biotin transporter BioY [Oscillospiraceae bacterium]
MKTKHLILCALFAAITAVLSQLAFPLPFTPVPINLATFSVFLAGGLLGAGMGAASQAVYVLVGALGVPVFAQLTGGLGIVAGPTGGYLLGYIAAAWLTGFLLKRLPQNVWGHMLSMAAGMLSCYVLGTAWFMYQQHVALIPALSMCVIPFLPGDILKIVVAAVLVRKLSRVLEV